MVAVTEDRLQTIRAALPKEGLFAEKDWLLSPDAFPIDKKFFADLEQLGHRLFVFQRACNQLYQLSVKGKQPEWVARYLDAGKPKELIEFSRQKEIRDDLPRVIRPDLILTENGYIIAEIDSVPGGIGLTGWLNQTYSSFDNDIIGDATGMLEGFRAVVPNGADIVISQESATYRPEMEWMAARLNQRRTMEHRTPGGSFLRKITSRKIGAPCIGSLNYSICQISPGSKIRCARTQTAASRSGRRSSHIWRRKCGSHFSGCIRFASFGGANWGTSISLNFGRRFPTRGCSIRRHCRSMR
ncbi:MAG: hypothetical protein DME76_19850 [Verrucomicrobia bacterium]|nr:MAG: hypothetical protein DME76_19850 [Verrucomicrobiota bacterium]